MPFLRRSSSSRVQEAPTVSWENRFDELVQYKNKHGDCNVPKSRGKLGMWVNSQRVAYRAEALAQDHIDRLESIGFEWALTKKKKAKKNVPWETRFNELVEYGDIKVPAGQGQLGGWVSAQRQQYKKGKLSQDRIDRLERIDFDWAPPRGRSRKRTSLSSKQNRFSSRKTNVESLTVEAGEVTIGEDTATWHLRRCRLHPMNLITGLGVASDDEVDEIVARFIRWISSQALHEE